MKTMKYIWYIFVVCMFFIVSPVNAAVYNIIDVPQANTIQDAVKDKAHPYLMGDNFDTLKTYRDTDQEYRQRFYEFYRSAKLKLKKINTIKLTTLNDYVAYGEDEILEFAFIYRMTGEEAFADAALNLILQTINIGDWHESNTIETASVSMVCAIGYDWIYDYLTDEQKSLIPNAVWDKSLSHAYGLYFGGEVGSMIGWAVTCEHNWSIVCNSGFGAAALGFMNDLDSEKAEKCAKMVAQGLNDVQNALAQLGPNGGWGESVNYSQYSFLHFCKYVSMLVEATGDDYAILDYDPIKKNVLYPMYLTGSQHCFNFHDSPANYPDMFNLMFAAKYYNDSTYAALRDKSLRIGAVDMSVFDLLWYVQKSERGNINPDGIFDTAAVMRKSFDDKNGIFAAIHGGMHVVKGKIVNHGFLDVGTFVLDALGERWAEALGNDGYSLEGYHDRSNGGMRWNYYRCRAEGSNTLVINPSENRAMDQVWGRNATLTAQNLNGENPSASVDLTPVYVDAKSAVRTLKLTDNRKNAELTDIIEMNKASEIYWFMHTKATITLSADKKTAILTKGAKQMKVTLSSPQDAVFTVMSATPLSTSPAPSAQNKNSEYKKLAIHLTNTSKATINVKFEPQYKEEVIEISDNCADIFNNDFENTPLYPNDKASGVFDLGYFKANVNKLSDYKEFEIVQAENNERALLIRWIVDSAAKQGKLSGGVIMASEAGSFNPSGVTVLDFSIKANQVSRISLDAQYAVGKTCNLFTLRNGTQFSVLKGNSWINIATATGDYQRIRVVLDTKSRRHMVLIDNKIVYSQEYPSTWVFGDNGLLRFQLTGGTAVSVDDLDSIYACRVYLGEMHIYTSEAYAYENMIANKSKNGIRVARFESDLYNGSSLDMTVFKAKYNNNALESAEKEDITINNNEEKYLLTGDTSDNVYYIWDRNMKPYFEKID